MKTPLLLLLSLFAFAPWAQAEIREADAAGIKAAVLDYIEGWYDGDAERMERCLHPDLAKRVPFADPRTGQASVQHLGAMRLVQLTRAGTGKGIPAAEQRKDITILDVYEDLAEAKLVSARYVDYFQLVKSGDRWLIVNVLWKPLPKTA